MANGLKDLSTPKLVGLGALVVAAVVAVMLAVLAVLGYFPPASGNAPSRTASGSDDGQSEESASAQPHASDDFVINDDVYVYVPGESPFAITGVSVDSFTVDTDEGIDEGMIVAAGVTPETPDGLLRRVESIDKSGDGYRVSAAPVPLTDAIDQCDVVVTATLSDDMQFDVQQVGGIAATPGIQQAHALEMKLLSITREVGPLSVTAADTVQAELHIDWGSIDFQVVNEIRAEALLDLTDDDAAGKSFDVDLISKQLPNIEFMVGPVPVVLTNDVTVSAAGDARVSYAFMQAHAALAKGIGFRYTSEQGVQGIDEDRSEEPRYDIKPTQSSFGLHVGAQVKVAISSKLYGIAGFELGAALAADADGSLYGLDKDEQAEDAIRLPFADWALGGKLDVAVTVPITGSFVSDYDLNPFDGSDEPLDVTVFDTGDLITLFEAHYSFGNQMPNLFTSSLFSEMNVPGPSFTFRYPDGWHLKDHTTNLVFGSESITLENERDIQVRFEHMLTHQIGGLVYELPEEVDRVGDVDFSPEVYDDFDNRIIADVPRFTYISTIDPPAQSKRDLATMHLAVAYIDGPRLDWMDADTSEDAYAIVPESFFDESWDEQQKLVATTLGMPFYYGWVRLYLPPFQKKLTEEEEEEVLAILQSFDQRPAIVADDLLQVTPSSFRNAPVVGSWMLEVGDGTNFDYDDFEVGINGTAYRFHRMGYSEYRWTPVNGRGPDDQQLYAFTLVRSNDKDVDDGETLYAYYDAAHDELRLQDSDEALPHAEAPLFPEKTGFEAYE